MKLSVEHVEFLDHLLRRLQARVAAVERGDVAELAGERAAAGELHRAQQIIADLDAIVGRRGKIGHRQALDRAVDELLLGPLDRFVQPLEQAQRRVAGLAAMQDVDVGIILRRGGNGRPAQRHDLIVVMRAPRDVVNAVALNVHARDEHGVRPGEIFRQRAVHVLVDKAHLPLLRDQRRDDEDALRRHETLHIAHQRKGMIECSEAVTVTRKTDEDFPFIPWDKLPQPRRFFSLCGLGMRMCFQRHVRGTYHKVKTHGTGKLFIELSCFAGDRTCTLWHT